MAERLTKKIFDNNGKQQNIYEWSSVSSLECNKKLGKLEDIMERLGINFVEDLEDEIRSLRVDKYVYKKDRDTWKRACELACGTVISGEINEEDYYDVIVNWKEEQDIEAYGVDAGLLINYFYQQAKNMESNNEIHSKR